MRQNARKTLRAYIAHMPHATDVKYLNPRQPSCIHMCVNPLSYIFCVDHWTQNHCTGPQPPSRDHFWTDACNTVFGLTIRQSRERHYMSGEHHLHMHKPLLLRNTKYSSWGGGSTGNECLYIEAWPIRGCGVPGWDRSLIWSDVKSRDHACTSLHGAMPSFRLSNMV
jgi:hypothetical protein